MKLTKRKKMFLIFLSVYIVFVIIIYFAMGGFYFSRSVKTEQTYSKRNSNEFVPNFKNKVYKGVYAGEVSYNEKQHYLLQYSGILIGEGRYVNIYYALEEKEMPSVIESDIKLEGDVAYLLLNPYGYYSGNNISYDKIFGMDTLIDPNEFLDTINENSVDHPEKLFVCSLTVMDSDMQVQMMLWNEEKDSSYSAKRFPDYMYAWAEKGNCKINQVKRNSFDEGLGKFLAGLADIITAPFQALIIGFYLLVVIVVGGPVK